MADWLYNILVQFNKGADVTVSVKEYTEMIVTICMVCPDVCGDIPRRRGPTN